MKTILTSVFLSLVLLAQGQTPDTSTIRLEIDSLILLNDSLVDVQKTDEALKVLQLAEDKCLLYFGEETALYATIAHEIGAIYYTKADYPNTEIYWLKSKNIKEKVLDKEHPDYVICLINLGELYKDMAQFEKAEPLYFEAKEIRKKVLGEEHPDYATSLSYLGIIYWKMWQFKKAEPLYLEAKDIREKILGKEHPSYGASLNNLAILYAQMGQFDNCETYFMEAKVIREEVLGKEHPDYATSLNNLGLLYQITGQFDKSEIFYSEAKVLVEKIWGKKHPRYAGHLYNLGNLYSDMGQYQKAESLHLEALEIKENIFGKEHPDYAGSLNTLGILYFNMGHYDKAELYYSGAKDIQEKVVGKEHIAYANSIHNLATLYEEMGQHQKAERLYLEALKTKEIATGKEHHSYAASLFNLGVLYRRMKQYEKSETLFLETMVIQEKLIGKEHHDYATTLESLGITYKNEKQYEKAETFYLKALAIREQVLGKEHPDYATSLYFLGKMYRELKHYQKADTFLLEALRIREKTLGKEHPKYVGSLSQLGFLYSDMGRYQEAQIFYQEANNIKKQLLLRAAHHMSERDLLSYQTTFIKNQDLFLSFTNRQKAMSGSAYDNNLFYKGFLLTATQQLNRLAQSDSISNNLFLQLKGYNRRLAKKYSAPISERDSNAIFQLEEKANKLEKKLARTVAGFGEVLQQVTWQEVQSVLKSNEATIEFVHYNSYNLEAMDSTMYAALVLRPGKDQPLLIPLFEEKSLTALLNLHQERRSDYVNDLYAIEDRGAAIQKESKQSLYELIWAPMEAQLEGITKVYFSPSGLLHRINLAAIPIGEEQSLCDNYNLVQVNSTRQLVIPDENISSTSNALLMGGIEYNIDSTAIFPESEDPLLSESLASRGESSFINLDSTLRGGSWNFLKYTEKEVVAIDRLFSTTGTQAETYTGLTATEDLFRQSGREKTSPSIIHLATHGFFFPDPVNNKKQSAIGDEEPIFKTSDHPMVRSGLILAGGNHVWQGKTAVPGMEDGILTAYEISQMDLSNTELVVLSACETGLGDIEGNEGVYGLQRAFKIAGAKYLIMSLWQVPDRETKDFMVQFYKHLINEDMTIPDAFRITQKEMKERFYNPHQWAGFILVE